MTQLTESERLADVADAVESIEELDGVTLEQYKTKANNDDHTTVKVEVTVAHERVPLEAQQREAVVRVRTAVEGLQDEYREGAPIDKVLDRAESFGIERSTAEREIENLRKTGEVYEPQSGHLRVV
jgi:replicative DNA helicase Mcm